MSAQPFAACTQCNATIYEGRRAIYDDFRQQFFCCRTCFAEWSVENAHVIQRFYERMNIGEVDT
jgi:hypothetical protein